ncbi:MAG: phospho-sugar mutase [Aeromicrobium sp.]
MSEAPAPHGPAFGTAGIRGPLGDGPGCVNRTVVAQVAAGLAAWLAARAPGASVVVGHDARHQSDVFARDVAEIIAGADLRASLLPGPLPTPVLAFAVGHLGASAGVMVTASHNPGTDNGLKVFLDDTSQVAAPHDREIEARIAQAATMPRSSAYERLDRSIVNSYLDAVSDPLPRAASNLRVAYTPLHGVGADLFLAAAARTGFHDVHVVEEQAEPDPDFPTVPYPNPEEPGALDRLLTLSQQMHADLAIAHDPDADRCAVAVRDGTGMTLLTGDELGILLADDLLARGATGTFASSIVSSEMLGRLAAAHGQRWVQTLTGFKWLGKVPDLAFGYEEALGYCVRPDVSRDKDGISAALAIMRRAAELHHDGKTLLDRRDELAREFGAHLTRQVAVRLPGLADVDAALQRLQAAPPKALGGLPVLAIDDLQSGFRGLPPTAGIRLGLDGARVIVRPSGTEPKLKAYIEAGEPATLAAIADDVGRLLAT